MHRGSHHRTSRGISLFEMFLIVSLLAVLGSVGFITVSGTIDNAKETKLNSDVKAINSAILSFIASNGDLSTAKSVADVLTRLKKASSNSRHNGLRGDFLDAKVSFEMQSEEECERDCPRAYWDAASMRFVVSRQGPPGIKAFVLDDNAATKDNSRQLEGRAGLLSLASEDTWIWDYVETPVAANLGPSVIPTTAEPLTTVAPSPVPAAKMPTLITPLSEPIFSIPPGTYRISNFDLSVTLLNPNPAGSSDIYYRIGFGSWMRYTGAPMAIPPGTGLQAQAIALDRSSFENSDLVGGNYEASPLLLSSPLITPDTAEFSLFGEVDITVSLNDTNPAGMALLKFRLDGGPWMAYTGAFILPASNFPGGADIEARAISSGSPYHLNSSVSREFIPIEAINLSGNTAGIYRNPEGPAGMVTNLRPGGSSSYFEWGDVNGNGRSASWMEFYGGSFTDIIDGQQFNVGSMTYYNGTINADTGADTIDLEISLDLDINGRTYRPYFDFTFELINTVNSNDEIASADFVYLGDARSSRTIVFDGYEFEFEIRFGETTANGFSDFDRFNVIENRDASVNLYGMFNLLGPATDPGFGGNVPILGGLVIDDDPTTGTAGDFIYQKIGYADPEQRVKSLLPIVQGLADDAEDARNIAIKDEENANKASQDLLSKIDDGKLYEAYLLYQAAAAAAESAEREAFLAERNVLEATPYAAEAKALALDDPKAVDEAIRVNDEVNATSFFATRARDAATAARLYADRAAIAWNAALTNSRNGAAGLEALAQYYAEVAKAEEELAKTAFEDAESASGDALSAAEDMIKKIGEGKYLEAEALYREIAPAALIARTRTEAAEEAATRAQPAATEANQIAGQEGNAKNEAADAGKSANEANAFAIDARNQSNLALVASADADSRWADLLTNGPGSAPEAYATYLADRAKVAEDEAKSARENAKTASEEAIKSFEESGKKLLEGKPFESQTLAENAERELANSQQEADLTQIKATEARSLAVEAGVIAGANAAANDAYSKALQSADNAGTYSQEAVQFARDAENAQP